MRGDPWRLASKVLVSLVIIGALVMVATVVAVMGLAVWWFIRSD